MPGAPRLIDLLFPPYCPLCGAYAPPLCAACRATIAPARAAAPPGVTRVVSAGRHDGPLREAVLRLKFSRRLTFVPPLADLLAEEWRAFPEFATCQALVPAPLHWTRQFSRGFNQAELLAEHVARRTGVPCRRLLQRVRRTAHQVGLPNAERLHNVAGSMRASNGAAGLRLVVVDDVCTTGATLQECARALLAAGAAEIFALTVTVSGA